MNCKQGEYAFIIRVPETRPAALAHAIKRHTLGHVIRCVSQMLSNDGTCIVWRIDKPFQIPFQGGVLTIDGIADRDLSPIRGLGEDASDDVRERLPPRNLEVLRCDAS